MEVKMNPPKYFLAVFGEPSPPEKDVVESGYYHPDSTFSPFPTQKGDLMLLYCTGSYGEYWMEVPGIGIIIDVNNIMIEYRFLPLSKTISKSIIDKKFEPNDAEKFKNIRFSSHWLFEISKESFRRVMDNRNIKWP
jgi:hypothetical protein